MPEAFCVLTMVVEEGETFMLPDGALIVAAEPIFISMDGKTRRRIVYVVRVYGTGTSD